MKEIICYQADDGTVFESKQKCLSYEKRGKTLFQIKESILEIEAIQKQYKKEMTDEFVKPFVDRNAKNVNKLQSEIHKNVAKLRDLYKQEFDLKHQKSIKSSKIKGS